MGTKLRKRFVAVVDGGPKRLLSIGQDKQGGLIVSPCKAPYNWGESGVRGLTVDEKFSIHRSLDSKYGANQLHHTLISKERPKVQTYSYSTAIRDGTVCPLYINRVKQLAGDANASGGTNIEISQYDPNIMTLLLAVFAAPPDADIDYIGASPAYTRYIERYEFFSVIVVATHILTPTLDDGKLIYIGSVPTIIGEMAPSETGIMPKTGLNPEEAREFVLKQFVFLHATTFEEVVNMLLPDNPNGGDPLWKFLFDNMKAGFIPRPREPFNYPLSEIVR